MGFGSLLRKARNIGPSVNLPGIGNISAADVLSGGMTKQADAALPHAQDTFRDTPIVGKALDADSSADIAARQQGDALGQAQDYQERMYGEAQGHLSPYAELGKDFMDQMQSGIREGEFTQGEFGYEGQQPTFGYEGQQPDAFNYRGPQMASSVDYSGRQPSQFSYRGEGQQGQLDYSGSPVDRSIESYMKDDPSLAWQQEQMEKAINRQGAAKGRWGGGATGREMMRETAGLLSQDYGNRFNRASQERMADVGAETDRYGRSLTGLGLQNQAEQSDYNRRLGQYGLDTGREQEKYSRAYTDTSLGNMASQDAFNRSQYGYESGVGREQDAYNRASQKYGYDIGREQNVYDRDLQAYGIEGRNKANKLAQLQSLANLGPQTAQSMANAALGQGSNLSNLAIQRGNVDASATMAGGNQLGKLLELAGQGAKAYGAV